MQLLSLGASGAPGTDESPDRVRSSVPAVVVGADANGVAVARTLGRAGIPVVIVDSNKRFPGMHSRYARPVLLEGMSGLALVDGLLSLRAELGDDPLLFLTYDYHVYTVAKHWDSLRGVYRMRLPDRECLFSLLHKSGFQGMAEKYGFPLPRAVTLRSEVDLHKLRALRFPAVVKPGSKDLFFNKLAPRACRVATREEAEALCRRILLRAPDLIAQEWIEGDETDLYFCLQYRGKGGATIGSFTGRKLRVWPPLTGNTVSCVAAPEAQEELEHLTTSFFDAAGFTGMCGMEFKRDRNNERFVMIEPTVGRTDWQAEIATLCGVSLPLAAYCHELGIPVPIQVPPAVPVEWRAPTCYWRSVIVTRRPLRGPAGAKVVRAAWRKDDPLLLVYYWLQWLLRLVRWLALWQPHSEAAEQSVTETMMSTLSVQVATSGARQLPGLRTRGAGERSDS